MKNSIIIAYLFLISIAGAFAQVREDMGYNKLQKVRWAYIEFMMKVERDEKAGKLPDIKKKTTTFQKVWNEILINNAYAVAPDGSICFFGGWPSKMSVGRCSSPWSKKGDEEVKNLGAYDSEQVCGSATKFRCNPTLFGSPTDDGKGICIDTGSTYQHLTEKCERASRALVPKIIESYKADPTAINNLGAEIKKFCDSYEEYDSCDDLNRRIKEITGAELGAYSGKGSQKPGAPEPVRAGGRTRNVNVVGEHLRPGGDLDVKTSNTGAQVLNRCQNLLKDKKDVKGRNILGVMNTAECTAEVGANLNTLDDFSKVVEKTDKANVVAKINAKAFEQNVLAMLANEIRFGTNKLNLADKEALFNSLVANAPDLKKDPLYKEAFERAYKNLDEEAKSGRLYPFEAQSTADQFNNLSSMVNNACKKIRDNYSKKFGDPGMVSRWWNSDEHKAFYTGEAGAVHREMDVLLSESVVGHLLSTSYFKEHVFDPSEDFVEECARNPSYQVIKSPIAADTIKKGHNEMMAMLKDNVKKLNEREHDLKDEDEADDILAEYLKKDSGIVNMTMDDLNSEDQYRLGALICTKTNQILKSDKNWRYADMAIGGLGLVAGVVLMATGVGSPLGVALTAASLGMAGYGGVRAVHQYRDAASAQKAADLALAQRRNSMQSYLLLSSSVSEQKKDALIQGGLSALTAFPAVRALNGLRGAKTVTAAGRISSGARTANNASRTSRALSALKRAPSQALAPLKRFNVTKVVSYFKRNPFKLIKGYRPKITFKKFLLFSGGVWLTKQTWMALTATEQATVVADVTNGFAAQGFDIPSNVMKDLDVSKLNLEESYAVLEQMVGSPISDENLEKYEYLLQPETHGELPPAVKEYLLNEQAMFETLKGRILELNK